jgi:hypothetical protein
VRPHIRRGREQEPRDCAVLGAVFLVQSYAFHETLEDGYDPWPSRTQPVGEGRRAGYDGKRPPA